MLTHFYFTSLFFILFFLAFALAKKKKETAIRAITLLVLTHITCLALWQGRLGFSVLITVALILCLYEIKQKYQVNLFWFWGFNLGFFLLAYFSDHGFGSLTALWVATTALIIFKSSPKTIKHPVYSMVFSTCFLIPCSIFLIKLVDFGIAPIITILLLLQLNDAFGYLFGKSFGKTKLFCEISPNKTLEGYLCGGIGIIIGILLLHTYIPVLSNSALISDILLFAIIFIFGNLGDLTLSALKRKIEIKDFGKILPGHGGILDRLDNILFVAPFFYILLVNNLIL